MHIDVAIKYAFSNYKRQKMISNSLWNEILLYLSLQRQVHKAIDIVGVKSYPGKVLKVEFSNGPVEAPVINVTPSKLKYWNVVNAEDLLEKMALFHIENF